MANGRHRTWCIEQHARVPEHASIGGTFGLIRRAWLSDGQCLGTYLADLIAELVARR